MHLSNCILLQSKSNNYLYDQEGKLLYYIDSIHLLLYNYIVNKKENGYVMNESELQRMSEENGLCIDIVRSHYEFLDYVFSNDKRNTIQSVSRKPINLHDILNSIGFLHQITIEVTEKCNFSCRYCYYGDMYKDNEQIRNKNINEKNILAALDYLISCRSTTTSSPLLISFYGGEPLMNFCAIKRIVDYLHEKYTPFDSFRFSFTTNGYLLDKYIAYLVENDFRILVSIDGNRMDDCNRVLKNGKESFDVVNKNIQMIKKKYPSFFNNNMNFISVLHYKSDIVSICEYFHRLRKTPILTTLLDENVADDNKNVVKF